MIGERLKHAFVGNEAWVLSYREECFDQIGLKASQKVPLYNGALECEFRKYEIFDGKYKDFKSAEGDDENKKEAEGEQTRKFKERKEFKEGKEFKPRFDKEFKPRREKTSGDFKGGDRNRKPRGEFKGERDGRPSREFKGGREARPHREFRGDRGPRIPKKED